jgi:hypothetical protein
MYGYTARLFHQDGLAMWLLVCGNKQIQHLRKGDSLGRHVRVEDYNM